MMSLLILKDGENKSGEEKEKEKYKK